MLSVIDVYTNMIQQPYYNLQTPNGAPKGPIFHFIKFILLQSVPWLKTVDSMPSI
jgi:hypothetical protein